MDLGSSAVWKERKEKRKCYRCGETGHIGRNCPGFQAKTGERSDVGLEAGFASLSSPRSTSSDDALRCPASALPNKDEQGLTERTSEAKDFASLVLPSSDAQDGEAREQRRGKVEGPPTNRSLAHTPSTAQKQDVNSGEKSMSTRPPADNLTSAGDLQTNDQATPTKPLPDKTSPVANLSNKTPQDKRCYKCGGFGHFARSCCNTSASGSGASGAESVKCFLCGCIGHYRRDCQQLFGSKEGRKRPVEKFGGRKNGRNNSVTGYKIYEDTRALPPYIDTHCHLEYLMERYSLDSYDKLQKQFHYPDNFSGCITSFCDNAAFSSLGCWEELLSVAHVWGSFGIHPHHARHFNQSIEDKLLRCLQHPKCVALGEIGLDYSKRSVENSSPAEQKKVFRHMLDLAQPYGKPVVLHCNEAEDDLLDCLSSLPRTWKIHLHCYTGSLRMARRLLLAFPNLYIGFTGHLTFAKFAHSPSVAMEVPLERLLIETDSPYMLPDYLAKRSNERWSHPPMAIYVAREIAQLREVPVEEVLQVVQENTKRLYGI